MLDHSEKAVQHTGLLGALIVGHDSGTDDMPVC